MSYWSTHGGWAERKQDERDMAADAKGVLVRWQANPWRQLKHLSVSPRQWKKYYKGLRREQREP